MSLQVPEPLHRWRLLLGAAAEQALDPYGELGPEARAADAALDWLYGREADLAERGERTGGLGASTLTTPEWINDVHALFPRPVIERLERDAVERFGIDDVVTNPDVLQRLEPSPSLLQAVLRTKHLMNPNVLAMARRLVAEVVRQLMAQLQSEVRTAFSGTRNRRHRTRRAVAANFDVAATIRENLRRYDPASRRLYVDRPLFNTRSRRFTEQWDIVILVDQSGSMLSSVIHSAVLAACLWNLPGMRTHLVAFDTEVVDLTRDVDDPVELLMKVQLGGGTDIAKAVGYAQSLLQTPSRSIVILITDFYEGGSPGELVRRVRDLVAARAVVIGLAALDDESNPSYSHEIAQQVVDAGAEVGAMTPGELAAFIADVVQGAPMRSDLTSIGTDALTVMSNAGFVKRATRELAAGTVPEIATLDDETVEAHFADGTVTTSPPGTPLRDTRCTCTASGMCRHRVMLVLAYQASVAGAEPEPVEGPAEGQATWTPADLDPSGLAPAVLAAAGRLAARHPVVTVLSGEGLPTARLPMSSVVFLTPDLANARCDCAIGYGCEHVAVAVWAFQQARDEGFASGSRTFELRGGAAAGLAAEIAEVRVVVAALVRRWWWEGTAQSPDAYARDLAMARAMLAGKGWTWALDALDRAVGQIEAQAARSTRFDPAMLVATVTECVARLTAAEYAAGEAAPPLPARVILGIGVPGEVVLDRQRLVSLGGRCWRSDDGDGFEVYLADPDTGAVGVVERSWPAGTPGEAPDRRVAGATVRQLLAANVLVKGAKRQANGRLVLPRTAQVTPLGATAWDTIRPPLADDAAGVLRALRAAAPASVAEPAEAMRVVRLDPQDDMVWGFDAGAQEVVAWAASGGITVRLAVGADPLAPGALDGVARAFATGGVTAVAGVVSATGDGLTVRVAALLGRFGAVVPAAERAQPGDLPLIAPEAGDAVSVAVSQTMDMLSTTLRQGLRSGGSAVPERFGRQATALRACGLAGAAGLFDEAANGLAAADHDLTPAALTTLAQALVRVGPEMAAGPDE